MKALDRLTADAELSPLDLQFAAMLGRVADQEHAEVLTLTAALVSRERRRGHPCLDLARWAGQRLSDGVEGSPRLPDLAAWMSTLRSSSLVGTGAPPTPLVLDQSERCYLHRYWDAQRRVAERIRALAEAKSPHAQDPAFAELFRRLFPTPAPGDEDADRQAWVAAAVVRNRFTVVSGGPGTGKTTTVARVLALLLSTRDTIHVELAAPTGKAAARLTESIRAQARELPVASSVRDVVARMEARTIHRLLGYNPRAGGFRHDAKRPLPCDVLVIDEASMVDLLLMDAALAAIPGHARVVLVGDKDQLASVEAGFVFGDCCEAAGRTAPSHDFAQHFRALSGREIATESAPPSGGMCDAGVELRLAWRFRHKPGIGAVADAVRRSDAATALAALSDDALADVRRFDLPVDASEITAVVAPTFRAVVQADSPDEALAHLAQARILCATNRGPWSVQRLNVEVEQSLELRGDSSGWYRGRPLLITSNDYAVGLFNGDVGVCFPDVEGRMRAWFAGANGVRSLPPAKLPPHETAWAMTVHKSQGSEFERVVFVLPKGDPGSVLLNRELIYTAVTRARKEVTVFADEDSLAHAIERRAERASGLRDLLATT